MFNIRDYMWEIFELSTSEEVHNVKLALDLFLTNVELGEERYEGSSIDYSSISHEWNRLTEYEKELQRKEFEIILNINYRYLVKYWLLHKRTLFDYIAHEEIHIDELDRIQDELTRIALSRTKRKRHRGRRKKKKSAPKIKKF